MEGKVGDLSKGPVTFQRHMGPEQLLQTLPLGYIRRDMGCISHLAKKTYLQAHFALHVSFPRVTTLSNPFYILSFLFVTPTANIKSLVLEHD